jgi:serine/threonine-protein kinase
MSQSWWQGPAANQVIAQRYQLVRQLREEPLSGVWLAKDLFLKAEVGLRLLAVEAPSFDQARRLFIQEALLGLKLRHPGILGVFFLGETVEELFLVMEPFVGESLLASLNRLERLRPAQALNLLEQVAKAAAFAHEHRVVHQSLDPTNILVKDADLRVANFAVPPLVDDEEVGHLELRAYQAPEVIHGDDVTPAANVFSLGVLGFRLVVGSLPYPLTFDEPFPYRLESPPLDLEEVPIPLQNLLLRCLAVDPEERFADAGEFLAALEQHREQMRSGGTARSGGWEPIRTAVSRGAGRSGEMLDKFRERGKDLAGKMGQGLQATGERLKAVPGRIWWRLGAGVAALIVLTWGISWWRSPAKTPPPETPVASAKPPAAAAAPAGGAPENAGPRPQASGGQPGAAPAAPGAVVQAPPPTAPPAAQPEEKYWVQAASYNRLGQAKLLENRLKEKKYAVRLKKDVSDGKTTYVVWVGPVAGRKAAQETAQRLKAEEHLTVRLVKLKPPAPARSQ